MKNLKQKHFKKLPEPYFGYCDMEHSRQVHAVWIEKGKNLYTAMKLCNRHYRELPKN